MNIGDLREKIRSLNDVHTLSWGEGVKAFKKEPEAIPHSVFFNSGKFGQKSVNFIILYYPSKGDAKIMMEGEGASVLCKKLEEVDKGVISVPETGIT